MSITSSSIPVLQGRAAAVLSWKQGELVLERRGETLEIPARAVARVHAEARCVTVELRVLAGATPSVHRIEDVSEAAAVVFADAVNALLPDPVEEVDGGALVVVRSFARTRLQKFRRTLAWCVLGALGGVVGLSVALTATADGPDAQGSAVASGILGGLTVLLIGLCVLFTGPSFHERRLRRHGVTVFAVRTDRPRVYQYADSTGTTRYLSYVSAAPSEQVSYNPQDTSDVLVLRTPFARFLDISVAWLSALAGLCTAPLTIWLAVSALG
ncbi:hypothetical protein OOK31_36800 [Streptomyces sp. NBC_00249]|uniref:hypothetical protein n=1 Tax=Streptomyces sp. NBC_00249 TaxID=2975690 RepID=UPI0022599EC2|nr:hypothetical protein [Streptomyces sp. NBC_00249]MCX5199372.1 hypothetical protein [Streptomyces sp. NBC_00249]